MSNGHSPASEVRKHSVTKGDVLARQSPFWFGLNQPLGGKGDAPPFWSPQRDVFLRGTIYRESMWTSAVHIALTKMSSQGWEIRGEKEKVVGRAQELLLAADRNQSWASFLQRQLQDFLLTGNGQFFEIVRDRAGRTARIIGLMHLDSMRVTRTGDDDIPCLYRDRQNNLHELRDYEVVSLSDQPDSADTFFGVGHCAAERALRAINKLAAIEQYVYEKVSGKRSLAIHMLGGVSEDSFRQAITAAQEEASQRGALVYMGATVVPIPSDIPPTLVTIPLASLPDGFDREQEFNQAVLEYADALGIDVQDLQPLSGRPLGTGAQSVVLDEKARGKGLAAWRQSFIHLLNENVMPDKTTFVFVENDLREKQQLAALKQTNAVTVNAMVGGQIIDAKMGQQFLVEEGVLPREMMTTPEPAGETLTDEEKLMATQNAPAPAAADGDGENAFRELLAQWGTGAGASEPPAEEGVAQKSAPPVKRAPKVARKSAGDGKAEVRALHDALLLLFGADKEGDSPSLTAARANMRARMKAAMALPPPYQPPAQDPVAVAMLGVLLDAQKSTTNGGTERDRQIDRVLGELSELKAEMREVRQKGYEYHAPAAPAAAPISLNLALPDKLTFDNIMPQAAPPVINVHVPEAPPAQIVVNVEKQDQTPVQVNVAPTPSAPIEVHVPKQDAPQIEVHVPKQDAPNIAVHVPKQDAPTINVHLPAEENVVSEVVRDNQGLIQRIVKRVRRA